MGAPNVREIPKALNLWGGFKDELIATAMTLTLLVLGSFLLTERLMFSPPETNNVPASSTSLPPKPEIFPMEPGLELCI